MSFFATLCSENARSEAEFGLCDDRSGTKAYTNIENRTQWIAVVANSQSRAIVFTALDHCLDIRSPDTGDQESLCDAMLAFDGGLFLVELKTWRTSGWIGKAEEQLRNSIALLMKQDDVSAYRCRKAYVCNRRYPNFHYIESVRKRKFFDNTGFRLDVNATIVIP